MGTTVGTPLSAQDDDMGNNLEYSLVNASPYFTIGGCTGQISISAAGLMYSPSSPAYTLTVSVKDNGVPSLTPGSNVIVTINVKNLNDPPSFDASASSFVYTVGEANCLFHSLLLDFCCTSGA